MKLFDVILKLIKTLGLISSEDFMQLHRDVKDWEDDARENHETDKLKAFYGKIHKGVIIRLLMPFAFYFALSKMREMMAGPSDDDLFD